MGGPATLDEIRIRDPFVLPVPDHGAYWLYGTTDEATWEGPGTGFDAYTSRDLRHWEGPVPVFRPPEGFWADRGFWAPEVHLHRRRPVMLASFTGPTDRRGVQTLIADHPSGPFRPHGDVLTPRDWECLDGTLHVDGGGVPWLVFCREWVQVHDGEIWAVPLTSDLDAPAGAPELLLRASEAPWTRPVQERHQFVTDGPFLHRTPDGTLLMLWSSFGRDGYCVGVARSRSGHVRGPWRHRRRRLFASDGGHAMLFRTFDGRLMMALHSPNRTPHERAVLIPVRERSRGRLRVLR